MLSPWPACSPAGSRRTYVTGDVITRLERRIDDLVSLVRDEMKETREIMLRAITGTQPANRRRQHSVRYRRSTSAYRLVRLRWS
ncbi:hypothetical protein C0214_01165 [Methylobacterium sp. DM1]|nr:hypothetical protein C0214_01165 [Methylobacterium sp. DM1]